MVIRRVVGDSMLPALQPGEVVVAGRARRRLQAGDMVIFRQGGLEKIKRVTVVDGGRLFVQGDNAAESTDSRHFGWIHWADVTGKVIWPRR